MAATHDWIALNNGAFGHKVGELSEFAIERLIGQFIQPGDAAIDCGVADGRMLQRMLKAVGRSGVVLGFEPIPGVFSRLQEQFPQSNVALLQMCVTDAVQNETSFYHVKDCRWISSLSAQGLADHDVEELTVPTTTLDAVVRSHAKLRGQRVTFIKLDIEGAEMSALRGGRQLLERDRPFLVFENGLAPTAKAFGYTRDEFFEFFGRLDYRLYDVFGTRLNPEHWDSVGKSVCWNFVAIHQDDPRLGEFLDSIEATLGKARRSLLRLSQSNWFLRTFWRV